MTETSPGSANMYLTTPLASLFAKTAGPIIFVTFSNGLYTVVDGWFIGRFVGPEALSAVTMVFPLFMMLIALGTLVSSGFSSVFARYYGAGQKELGEQSMLSAALLSVFICALLIGLYDLWGHDIVLKIANGSVPLAEMGDIYLSLTITYSPLFFMTALLSDSLRCQGHLVFMTLMAIAANLLNMVFNYILIVNLDMGVAGSAYGTAMAQGTSVLAVLTYLYLRRDTARFRFGGVSRLTLNWGNFLALGAPISLTYVGVSALIGATIFQIQVWNADNYETVLAAYGIITRLLTFGYMPILGMTLAQQAIVGNNFGAGQWARTFAGLKFSVTASLIYCAVLQVIFISFPAQIAGIFVDSVAVQAETARILPYIAALYALFGPLAMVPGFFQAVGDAKRAAILGLTKVFLISLPLILVMPSFFGEAGIWYAAPISEIVALLLTLFVLLQIFKHKGTMINWLAARTS